MSAEASRRGEALLDWGAAGRAVARESRSGDRHVVAPFPGGIVVAAVDGLGHGEDAALAADAAAAALLAQPDDSVIALVRRCHEALHGSRGVVMSLASFSARDATMTWIGVGNVEGVLLRADPLANPSLESLLLRGGVVGYQLPQLYASVMPVAPGDTLLFATDGIRSDFLSRIGKGDRPQQLADRILANHAKGSDDALVLVAEFRGAP